MDDWTVNTDGKRCLIATLHHEMGATNPRKPTRVVRNANGSRLGIALLWSHTMINSELGKYDSEGVRTIPRFGRRLYPAPRSNPAQRPPATRSAPAPLLSATPARRSVPAHVDYWPALLRFPLRSRSAHMLPQRAATPGQWHLKKTPHDACAERHMYRKLNEELRFCGLIRIY
jgi:hypothetical protein